MLFYTTDRIANLITGAGTAKDKSAATQWALRLLTREELEAAYRSDWLARKIVDIIPFDMTRAWREWQAAPEQITALEAEEARLQVKARFTQAQQRARLYGGAALFIGTTRDEDPTQELVPERVGLGGLRYLHVLAQHEVTAGALIRDPLSPYYGEPEHYELRAGTGSSATRIHPSRIIPFVGAALPDPFHVGYSGGFAGWGDPVLQIVHDAVLNAGLVQNTIASLLPEAKTDVVTVPGLTEALATPEGTARYARRFAEAAVLRSIHNITLIDGGNSDGAEQWQQRQVSFTGLPDVARLYLQVAAGAADIPATRLLGQAPAGLNATGDSDVRNYYDHISAKQESEFRPRLSRLDEILIRSALGTRPPEVHFRFAPLWQLSDSEKAEIAYKKAQATKIYTDTGLVDDEVLAVGVRNQLTEDGTYPGIEAAFKDYDAGRLGRGELEDPEDDDLPGGNVVPLRPRVARDAAPRTLYVSRKLKNGADLLAWARSQGFTDLMPAGELHVTIAYSKAPVDWMAIAPTWQGEELKVNAGGPRLIERFGEAVVLLFASSDLRWRHNEIREAGASWDHPDYQPHVTFTWNAGDVDLSAVQAYNGPLVFGPEVFADVDEDWRAKVEAAE